MGMKGFRFEPRTAENIPRSFDERGEAGAGLRAESSELRALRQAQG
jgi:hypothetical protein